MTYTNIVSLLEISYISIMDPVTYKRTKAMLVQDWRASGKTLGEFAIDWLDIYDDVCYELELVNATSNGKRVTGTAVLGSCEGVETFLKNYNIAGTYNVHLIDTQVEFFKILQEIKEDIEDEANPNKSFYPALQSLVIK